MTYGNWRNSEGRLIGCLVYERHFWKMLRRKWGRGYWAVGTGRLVLLIYKYAQAKPKLRVSPSVYEWEKKKKNEEILGSHIWACGWPGDILWDSTQPENNLTLIIHFINDMVVLYNQKKNWLQLEHLRTCELVTVNEHSNMDPIASHPIFSLLTYKISLLFSEAEQCELLTFNRSSNLRWPSMTL